ncbi:MAG: PGF-CTERM sorting domain-containing protein [Methanosarcinaceae archaeon]|uniref:PGF-CTERM sorting domain-containing protein n=1 Tax=Methanosarcina sp. MTP4 TaxID=1434100 RepID=UPI00064F53E5|nr:PGF-CTERM sorting domain-containing protein [Methanosarcina sp. MTP4]
MNLGMKSILLAILMIMLACSFPVSAQEESPAAIVAEIGEHAEELSTVAGNIHDETEMIADDESLDEALRAKGEEVHLSSHDIDHCAQELLRSVETLNGLVADPEANMDAIEAEIADMKEHIEECEGIMESKGDIVHALGSEVPETHAEYADNTHDYYHEAEAVLRGIDSHVGELEESLGIGTASAASAAPVSGNVAAALDEVEENANELLDYAGKIHDETEYIADDEALSEDIRAVGEEIHLSSHDIEHCAKEVLEHVENIRGLAGDVEANKAAIDEEIGEMNEHLEECAGIIESKHDKLHELTGMVPETHAEYADNTHDYYHETEYIVADIKENVGELQEAIENPTSEAEAKAAPEPEAEAAAEEESGNSAPGFGLVLAVAGMLCTVFFARRK